MPEPSLSALAVLLRPFVTSVYGYLRRLHAERRAGQMPLLQPSPIVDELLTGTLDRVRGGNVDSGWWLGLLDQMGQQYVAPDFLTKPALLEWLVDESVVDDLKAIALGRIMATAGDEGPLRDRLAQSYSNRTGEAANFAAGAIDAVVAVLVAGYIESIPADQRAVAGMVQTGFSRTDDRLDRLIQSMSSLIDPITRDAHTERASKELARILTLRAVNPAKSQSDIRELQGRLDGGDLAAADDETKNTVRYWVARLCASDPATLKIAREIREEIRTNDPYRDLSIVDALIVEAEGNPDEAIRILRDRDNPDARTALFGVIARARGSAEALHMYSDRVDTGDTELFTAVGWRIWAGSMAEVGAWEEAAQCLARLDEIFSANPALPFVEGIINAQLLLPPERRSPSSDPQYFAGITPNQGDQAERAHERATTCFESARVGLKKVGELEVTRTVTDWQHWLELMDPKGDNAQSARDNVRQNLESDNPDVNLMLLAWAFGISIDPKPLRRYLDEREKLGGLNDEEVRAQCLLFLLRINSGEVSRREFLAYLDAREGRLSAVIPVNVLIAMKLDALVADNQTERARAFLAEVANDLEGEDVRRLSALINAREGLDSRKELERVFHESGKLIDLQQLIECLKEADDREALLPLLEELVKRQRTVRNAWHLVACLCGPPFFDHHRAVEFLDSNSDLVEQSFELRSVRAWALFNVGRLIDARELNEPRLEGPEAPDALNLDINIAIASGDWERTASIAEREWQRRDRHDAETLITLAQIAGRQSLSVERALSFARLAADKAPDNPQVLAASYWLHFRLGRDEEADRNWLMRAFELSSDEEGPLWSADLRTVVTKWMPERQERLSEVESRWLAGEIPNGVAASLFNVPVTYLLIQMPETNSDQADRRGAAVVPIVFGGRSAVELRRDWSVGLDLSSILVLYYVGLLEPVFDEFRQIKIAPDVMLCLLQEQDRVGFHQPSRVRAGQQVRTLCNQQRLRVASDLEAPTRDISEEVGKELATLLQAARRSDGKVVCVLPIYRPDSLMEKEADTADWDDLIVPLSDFCSLLHEQGKIDVATYERARLFLNSQGQSGHGRPHATVLNKPVFLDGLALTYLQNAKVLDQVAAARLDLRLHPEFIGLMDEFVRAGDLGDDLATKIDGIRHVLRSAVESGTASYLPRKGGPDDTVLNRNDQFMATQSLLEAVADCDALCIDDRFVTSKERFALPERPDSALPIVCTLDLLRFFVDRGRLTPGDHWAARHKLRAGGFAVIPFEDEELLHWLKAINVEEGHLVESAELRAIRQSAARTVNLELANPAEITSLLENLLKACATVIRALWSDETLPIESTGVISDWIWRHLMVTTIGNQEFVEDSLDLIRMSIVQRVSLLLLPPIIESEERRVRYRDWIQGSVLRPLRLANEDLIQESLDSLCDMIHTQDNEEKIYGSIFLEQLPQTERHYLMARYPDRTLQWGYKTAKTFDLDADVSIIDEEVFTAARDVLSGVEARTVQTLVGEDVSVRLDPEDHNIVLEFHKEESRYRTRIPELSILSPHPETRVATLRSLLQRFGPTAPDLNSLFSALELQQPDDQELSVIFQELMRGVVAVQGSLLSKIQQGQSLGLEDILPQDIAYFERFVGPLPSAESPESYLHDVLVPYRKAQLKRDLMRGIDICCLGALRDDLCPGEWVEYFDHDSVWEALSACDAGGAPFSLLGALDIALHRQDDERFREFAQQAVAKLCDDGLGHPKGVDVYRLLWLLMQISFNHIHLVKGCTKQPGFWKRMSAWMQAQFVARALMKASGSIDVNRMNEWFESNLVLVGAHAELVDARQEPMLVLTRRMSAVDVRSEVIGRLAVLKSRHEHEGRLVPLAEEIDSALKRAHERGEGLKCFFPGPLEGHRRPTSPADLDVSEALRETLPDVADPTTWNVIGNASHIHALADSELAPAREALRESGDRNDDAEIRNLLLSLELASIVAKTNRDTLLADAISDATAHLSRRISDKDDVWMILPICLQAAAAFEEHAEWFKWLEETLARIARSLPGPPSKSLWEFLEQLDVLETILPIDSWFHRRARSIASAGGEFRP